MEVKEPEHILDSGLVVLLEYVVQGELFRLVEMEVEQQPQAH